MTLPLDLLIRTAAVTSLVLVAVLLIQLLCERIFKFYSLIPEGLREQRGPMWLIFLILIEVMLYAIAPTIFFFWIYALLPFFSYRAGIAVGLFLYLFGVLPFAMGLSLRLKLPGGVLTFTFFFTLLKLTACWATLTYLLNL